MKNLAGVKDADITIQEELYLAGIPQGKVELTNSEVPYTIIGRIGNWIFKRAWYYWMAHVENPIDGVPLKDAIDFYNKPYPSRRYEKLGEIVRAGGCAGCSSPEDHVSQPIYNEELNEKLKQLGYKEEYSSVLGGNYIPISRGEMAKLCQEGKLDVERYVETYHIDDQIGLNEFANFIKKLQSI